MRDENDPESDLMAVTAHSSIRSLCGLRKQWYTQLGGTRALEECAQRFVAMMERSAGFVERLVLMRKDDCGLFLTFCCLLDVDEAAIRRAKE